MTNVNLLGGQPIGDGTDFMPGGISAGEQPADPAPKRTMTEAHKQAIRDGRERAKQSRGRPASRPQAAPMPAERPRDARTDQAIEPNGFEDYAALAGTLTRQSRVNGDNTFDIPMAGRIPGWDYQWVTFKLMGADVDASETVSWQMGGWIPAKPAMFPTLVPKGWDKPTIETQGMRLMMRPMRLTQEAIAEQQQLAFEQKQAKLAQAQAGEGGSMYAPRRNDGLSVTTRPLLE